MSKMWNVILDSWKSLLSLTEHKVFLFTSRGKAQNTDDMYYHLEIIAISCSRRGWGEAGAEPVWWSAGEPVKRPGGQGAESLYTVGPIG